MDSRLALLHKRHHFVDLAVIWPLRMVLLKDLRPEAGPFAWVSLSRFNLLILITIAEEVGVLLGRLGDQADLLAVWV